MNKSFHFLRSVAVVASIAALAVPGAANASSCSASFYSTYQSCQSNTLFCSPYSSPEEYVAAHPHCFPGGAAASAVSVSGTSFVQVGAISGTISNQLLGSSGPTGLASAPLQGMAAGEKKGWNFWGSFAANDTRQQYTVGPNTIKNDVNLANVVFGADFALQPGMVLGISGAFDRGDGSTQPTAAAARQANVLKGWSLAPYIGYQISKELALDATAGIGMGTNSSAGGMEVEGDRFFYAANLTYSRWFSNLQVSAKAGYLYGEEAFENAKINGNVMAGTAIKSRLGRYQLGAQAAYWLGNGIQPYAGLSYLADTRSSSGGAGVDPIGGSAWQWSVGMNFFLLSSGVTGGVAYTQEDGRNSQKNNALTVNIGIRY